MKKIVLSKHNLEAIRTAIIIAEHVCRVPVEFLHATIDDGDKEDGGLPRGTVELTVVCKGEVTRFLIYFPSCNELFKAQNHPEFIVKASVSNFFGPRLTFICTKDGMTCEDAETLCNMQIAMGVRSSGE